ncbi:hypothetical protein [Vannielia litorea]|uniref:Lipoprotein n=1 Tax=Vannielia litorea TaxID=1217970 RepID=A0A1N6GLW0_9RHOB|nr:hypothetical protein [Vannielia litorea]SIO08493.1 hypothetical protein SAMN05444002_2602 [Vannielia litorea]
MNILKITALLAVAGSLAACSEKIDKTVDRGFDNKDLTQLKAGIWIDPNGCDHWIIDDGVEGYLSQRLDKFGKPVCSGAGPSSSAVGGYKSGSAFPDPI